MEHIVISVKNTEGSWASFELPWDSDLDELARIFHLIGQYLTFSSKQMDEVILNDG